MGYANIIVLVIWFFSIINLVNKTLYFIHTIDVLNNKIHIIFNEEINLRKCAELLSLKHNLEDAYVFLSSKKEYKQYIEKILNKKEFLIKIIHLKLHNFNVDATHKICLSKFLDNVHTIVYKQHNPQVSSLIPNWYFKFLKD